MMTKKAALLAGLLCTGLCFGSEAWAAKKPKAPGKDTHVGAKIEDMVNMSSNCVTRNDSVSSAFFYDANSFYSLVIPPGTTFVVTDIVVDPFGCGESLGASTQVLAFVENSSRRFTIHFRGDEIKHYALTGGLAFPAGAEPRALNTSISTGSVVIQLLGYFVKGNVTDPGEPRF
jgi:hypothetical protein